MEYTYNGNLARIVGSDAASIFEYINYFVCYSRMNNLNLFGGKYWMLGSTDSIKHVFGHLSEQQVVASIATLVGMQIVDSHKDANGQNWLTIGKNGERFYHAI